jgi:hypothetical protein
MERPAIQPCASTSTQWSCPSCLAKAVDIKECRTTHSAYAIALEALAETPAAGQQYLLLITDGQPTLNLNCEPGDCTTTLLGAEQAVVDEVARAMRDRHVRTFVLGLPGSEVDAATGSDARWWLSQAAEAGGTSPADCTHDTEPYCHFDITGEGIDVAQQLDNALQQIAGQLVNCAFALPPPPEGMLIDLNAIYMILWPERGDPIQLLRNENPDCRHGWYYDEWTWLLSLCPDSCALVRSDPLCRFQLLFEEAYGF